MNNEHQECLEILETFNKQIKVVNAENPSNLSEIHKGIRICQIFMQRLRLKVLNGCLETIQDEIYFFKHVKPHIMGHLLFLNYLQKIFELRPLSTVYDQQKFLEENLDHYNNFKKINHTDFAYFDNGNDIRDELYFVRCNLDAEDYHYHPYSMVDSDFATSKDYLFADFIAHKKIVDYLEEELIRLKITRKKRIKSLEELLSESPFYWSTSKIALVELIYGLTYSGCINNGNLDIKELANALCKFFHVENLDVYRLFIDLKARKKNQTVFLDKIRICLINKLEDE
nr:RteC domain-containing protein [uncultured Carboxylicivirga sp.]